MEHMSKKNQRLQSAYRLEHRTELVSVGSSIRKLFEFERPGTFQDLFVFWAIYRHPSILTLKGLNFKLHFVEVILSCFRSIHRLLKCWHIGVILGSLGRMHTRIDDIHDTRV